MQSLIELLAQYISMDLDHIKGMEGVLACVVGCLLVIGNKIVKGDKKHIFNLLQLLFELSRLITDKED